LGEALFFDKILSGNKDTACATCHQPGLATGDALSVSIGTGATGAGANRQLGPARSFVARNSSPLFNLGGVERMFWDGRVERTGDGFTTPAGFLLPAGLDSALAAQAMFPVSNRTEMRGNSGDITVTGESNELATLQDADLQAHWDGIMARLRGIPAYLTLLRQAYPTVAEADLGFQHAANAIAAFETSRFQALSSPFDRYVGGDDTALSEAAKRGGQLFYGRARCSQCHSGPLLSDLNFHNIAAPQVGSGNPTEAPLDSGRFNVTGNQQDRFRFRTPILRNVAQTGPWMHSGAYTSLGNVVRHYRNPAAALNQYDPTQLRSDLSSLVFTQQQLAAGILNNLDPIVAPPLPLNNGEVADLVAFLESLTDPNAQSNQAPASVPSGLPVGN
jgi:cytochrome c peroxidase